jgi:hypothetical protein
MVTHEIEKTARGCEEEEVETDFPTFFSRYVQLVSGVTSWLQRSQWMADHPRLLLQVVKISTACTRTFG